MISFRLIYKSIIKPPPRKGDEIEWIKTATKDAESLTQIPKGSVYLGPGHPPPHPDNHPFSSACTTPRSSIPLSLPRGNSVQGQFGRFENQCPPQTKEGFSAKLLLPQLTLRSYVAEQRISASSQRFSRDKLMHVTDKEY